MDKYIAIKPVRFNRDYRVGEAIPESVIAPHSVKRLLDAGKIAAAPIPSESPPCIGNIEVVTFFESILDIGYGDGETPDIETRAAICKEAIADIRNAIETAKSPQIEPYGNSDNKPPDGSDIGQDEPQEAADAASDMTVGLPDTVCPICGKKCGSKAALTRHMRETHGAE